MIEYFYSDKYSRIEEIFLCRQLGMTLRQIGGKYDLSQESVRRILVQRERKALRIHHNSEPDKRFLSPWNALMRARQLNQIAQA